MNKRYIHLGSWNIEHLSKRGGREESAYALTEHIEMASLDVLALQEVYVTHKEDGLLRNAELDMVMSLLKEHTADSWKYELFPNRDPDDESQLCGVIWNASVMDWLGTQKLEVSHRKDGYSLWDRVPHAVHFKYRQKTDFVVIPLHMKSNYGGASRAKGRRAV